jgi:polyisoprenoid-binding protein YceI
MYKNIFIASIALLSAHFSSAQQTIDAAASKVKFEISNWSISTVEGTFGGMTGTVNINSEDLGNSKIDVCIDAKTVNTENEKRDEHLREEDFFHVEKFPTICFTSTSITTSPEGYIAKGTLTMHGESKEITIPLTYSNNTYNGKLTIDRTEFGVGSDSGFMVGKEVSLEIISVIKE